MMVLRIDPLMNSGGTVCGGTTQFEFLALLRNLDLVTGKNSAAHDANAIVIKRAPFMKMIVHTQHL
jgi:hypothetical protein